LPAPQDAHNIYIVQELCAGGDVASLLAAAPGGRLEEADAAAVALAVLRFLAATHAAGVCYGDVKPAVRRAPGGPGVFKAWGASRSGGRSG
jgi:serine/threonine protein kinase